MPDDIIPNCGSQLERAIRALFINAGAATVDDCYVSNESRHRGANIDINLGVTDIMALSSTTNPQETSGNEIWQVRMQNKFGAALQPEEVNPQVNRILCDERVGRQLNLLMQSDDGQTLDKSAADITDAGRGLAVAVDGSDEALLDASNNADMAEFTCLNLRFLGSTRGIPEDNSCAWVEIRNFEITACPAAVD